MRRLPPLKNKSRNTIKLQLHYSLFAGIAILLWATLAILVTQLNHIPPFLLLAITLIIGGSVSIFHWRKWQLDWKILTIGVSGIFGYHFFLFMALRLAPPLEANLINYLWPLLIMLMTPIFLAGYRLTIFHFVGGAMGFFGVYLLIGTSVDINLSGSAWMGYFLAFLAAVFWASYSLLSKRLVKLRTATVGLFCLISGSIALLMHVFYEKSATLVANDWLYIIVLGIGPTGIAFYAWDKALKQGDPRVIGSLSYLTPLISTLLLFIFNDRAFESSILIALFSIVGGAFISSYKPTIKMAD